MTVQFREENYASHVRVVGGGEEGSGEKNLQKSDKSPGLIVHFAERREAPCEKRVSSALLFRSRGPIGFFEDGLPF